MSNVMLHAPQNAKACKTVEEAVGRRRAVLEPKLDGWRVIAANEDGYVQAWTRTGTEVTGKMPQIEQALEHIPIGTVLDGEVVAFERGASGLIHSWGKVQSVLGANHDKAAARSHVLTYVVFDILSLAGLDCRGLSFEDRRIVLADLSKTFFEPVVLIPQVSADEEAYETLLARGYEGGIVKWLDAPYASGQRGKGWFKLKATATVDAVVMGFKAGLGDFSGLVGAVVFGQPNSEGVLVERGRCSGMDMSTRIAMSNNPDSYMGRVIEVAHMGVTEHGRLRHPQFRRLRSDRSPSSVSWHDG